MSVKISLRDRLKSPSKRPRLVSNRPSLAKDLYGPAEYQVPSKTLPDRYQVEGADAKGRAVNFSVSMPPEFRRTISKINQSGEFGFETEQDTLRWCINSGLKELEKRSKNPETKSSLRLLQSFVALAANKLAFLKYERTLKNIFETVDRLNASGDYDEAEGMAEQIHRDVDGITDPYWRRKYFDMATEKLRETRRLRAQAHHAKTE